MTDMPKEIWVWELKQSYEVLCPVSYKTSIKNDCDNGWHSEPCSKNDVKYIRADVVDMAYDVQEHTIKQQEARIRHLEKVCEENGVRV